MTPTDQYQPQPETIDLPVDAGDYFDITKSLIRARLLTPAAVLNIADYLYDNDKINWAQYLELVDTPRFF